MWIIKPWGRLSKERFFFPSFLPWVFAQLYKSLGSLIWSHNSSLIGGVLTKVLFNLSYPIILWVTLNIFPEYFKSIFLSTEVWIEMLWGFIRDVWKMLEFGFHFLFGFWCVSFGVFLIFQFGLGFLIYFLFTLWILWFVRSVYCAGEFMWYIGSVGNSTFMEKPQSCGCKKGTTTSGWGHLTLFWKSYLPVGQQFMKEISWSWTKILILQEFRAQSKPRVLEHKPQWMHQQGWTCRKRRQKGCVFLLSGVLAAETAGLSSR